MNINTESLAAFINIFQEGSYTKAAQNLGISQSAISQKMAKLEDQLQTTLLIKSKDGIRLTASGEKLLVFAKQQLQMEKDFLSQFNQYQDIPAGVLRVAGFSSITRSVLIPSLAPLMLKGPNIQIEFSSFEVIELEAILKQCKADLIITDYLPQLTGIEAIPIGKEEYVITQKNTDSYIPDIYLDHGPHDNATESFFQYQKQSWSQRRGFMGDVYGIIEGVELGLGKAIMSHHLIKKNKKLKLIKAPKKYYRTLYLCYYKQGYYSPLQMLAIKALKLNSMKYL